MEIFPGWALVATLAQTKASDDRQIINLLGLHVLTKTFLYSPAYILDIGAPRTLTHTVATASVINVAWRLAIIGFKS
jgi:uncharacterized MAPEG superfamily protein